MKRSWNTLSQMSNGTYTVQDFERAAYRLATEQVLYAADARSRVIDKINYFKYSLAGKLKSIDEQVLGHLLRPRLDHRYPPAVAGDD